MDTIFTLATPVCLPIVDQLKTFPVRRIYCVGRNYTDHVREMGIKSPLEPPFFFCKPSDAQSIVPVKAGQVEHIPYPPQTKNYHHEIELVVAIGKGGSNISKEDAESHILGYAVGLDMTRRDLQLDMRNQGRPWEIGKAFDYSAPIGPIRLKEGVPHPLRGAIRLKVNGETKQIADLASMIWSVEDAISHLSAYFELQPGDLLFMGTPAGVGPVAKGDSLAGTIDNLVPLRVKIMD
ncbi:fumarylacetoacetate hydrolase family protein [Aeromonas dhakensis]|uniref:fumarylacetoacetate hydrolase family protein n=1 Tax=Aeromonas dhakensis TaxID=196024 RepID=UPI0021B1CA7C|nr:fumarylacetoacetate hydrolase family protein [Aeromonas dhakensis]UXB10076.1 fumarylacetoacetate hydrolase family protein [Aeromonas dhakensis]